jgi:hypothetical protein
VAWPAGSWTLTMVLSFFLGGIANYFLSDLRDLVE